nr:MAG TPA: Head fiber protein [Crassvirales sp.]
MKQIDIDRMVDARNMSPEHKNILRRALGYAAGDGRKEIQEKLDSLDKEVGNILSSLGSTLGAVTLEIGNDEGVKARNLAKLKTVTSHDSFFADINYGFGTASWNDGVGGVAFIITAGGTAKPYSISADGSVSGGIDINLKDPNTDIFIILEDNEELPTNESEIKGKIYCKKNPDSTAGDNQYNEYIYVKSTKKWEKVGEFQAEPNLSGYAKLDSPRFTGSVFADSLSVTRFIAGYVNKNGNGRYFRTFSNAEVSDNKTYNTSGGLSDIGAPEDFIFTLEDGSTVTKSIRVISTTSQAEA